jgi:enterochelin esterase-like enzyme
VTVSRRSREAVERIRSRHLGNERAVWIREPARGAATRLVVFLDAEMYRDRVGAPAIIDELEKQRTIAGAWFVFVSSANVDARWKECPCYPPFARFVVEELLPWLETRRPEIAQVQERVLVGLSYTGLAAAFVAREFPGQFQKVISQSGSFWWRDGWLIDRYRAMRRTLPTAFHLDVGTKETQTNLQHHPDVFQKMPQIEGVRKFRDVLLKRGHEVRYVEFAGGHAAVGWRSTLREALRWALE